MNGNDVIVFYAEYQNIKKHISVGITIVTLKYRKQNDILERA